MKSALGNSMKANLGRENVELNYLKAEDVNDKRQNYMKFKGTFAEKISHLRNKGKRIELMGKVAAWVDQNEEMLFRKIGRHFKKPSVDVKEPENQFNVRLRRISMEIPKDDAQKYHDIEQFKRKLLVMADKIIETRRLQ